jgi:hypothetical protein
MLNLMVGSQGGTLPTLNNVMAKQTPLFYPTCDEREQDNMTGWRCWTVAHKWRGASGVFKSPDFLKVLGDSGAFTHPWDKRWSFEQHEQNVKQWETSFAKSMRWKEWYFDAIASYDLLIDEVWSSGIRVKQRWSKEKASWAVDETVKAAQYLASRRAKLSPRSLVLGCQGVTAEQYYRCLERVLDVATPEDWIGLGGWCILGIADFKHYLPEFYRVLNICIPLIAKHKIKKIHLFGVRYEPAVAPFTWICHQHGIVPSTDNSRPILDCRNPTPSALKQSGARKPYWRDNVEWWRDFLANINRSVYYQKPSWKLAWDAFESDKIVGNFARQMLKNYKSIKYENSNFI